MLTKTSELDREVISWRYSHYNQHPQSFPSGVIRFQLEACRRNVGADPIKPNPEYHWESDHLRSTRWTATIVATNHFAGPTWTNPNHEATECRIS
jgi:hypothetical protein